MFANLQPLNVCLTYQRTNEIVRNITVDHDIEVQEWADYLQTRIVVPAPVVSLFYLYVHVSQGITITT